MFEIFMAAQVHINSYAYILPPLLGFNAPTCKKKPEDIINNT
jgi:hypothetical protein